MRGLQRRRVVVVALWFGLVGATGGLRAGDIPMRELTAGLTLQAFQKEFDARMKTLFAPVSLSTHYRPRGRVAISVVWEKRKRGRIRTKTGLKTDAMQKEVADADKKEYRLELMTGSGSGGPERYSAVWSNRTPREIAVRYGYPTKRLLKAHHEFKAKGFQVRSVMAVDAANNTWLGAAWEKNNTVLRELQVDLAEGAFRKEARERPKKGWRLVQACAYFRGRRLRVACIWQKTLGGPVQEIHSNLSEVALKRMNEKLTGQGYVPSVIAGYAVGRGDRYIAAWEK